MVEWPALPYESQPLQPQYEDASSEALEEERRAVHGCTAV